MRYTVLVFVLPLLLATGCVRESPAGAEVTATSAPGASFAVLKAWPEFEGKDEKAAVLVFRDEDTYLRRFDESYPEDSYVPPPRADKIDFAAKQVVAILWGAKPNTAYRISVLSVVSDQDEVVVTVKTHIADMGSDMVTHPSIALAIPRRANVKVVVSGDRTESGAWWGDFTSSEEEGLQVIVK